MAESKRCILLTGAPESDALVWDEGGLLSSFSIPTRERFNPDKSRNTTSSSSWPKWRAVPLNRYELQEQPANAAVPTQFLSFDMIDGHRAQQLNQDFLDHSVAVLEDVHPSQLANVDITAVDATAISNANTSFADISFMSGDTSIDATVQAEGVRLPELTRPVTDIKRIPGAETIDKIAPQTATVNLIAGVISVSTARSVRLRRRNTVMDIVEVMVGDETRAGFAISVWLVPEDSQRPPVDDLREKVRSLRSGDIVLICNVALSTFRGCVYGQSLSRRMSKNSTTIRLLKKGQEAGLDHFMLLKANKVEAWADQFIWHTSKAPHGGAGVAKILPSRREEDLLPPDTQD